jgi:hypothetical protein
MNTPSLNEGVPADKIEVFDQERANNSLIPRIIAYPIINSLSDSELTNRTILQWQETAD